MSFRKIYKYSNDFTGLDKKTYSDLLARVMYLEN